MSDVFCGKEKWIIAFNSQETVWASDGDEWWWPVVDVLLDIGVIVIDVSGKKQRCDGRHMTLKIGEHGNPIKNIWALHYTSDEITQAIKSNFTHLGYPDIQFTVSLDKQYGDFGIGVFYYAASDCEYSLFSEDDPRNNLTFRLMAFCVGIIEVEINKNKYPYWPKCLPLDIELKLERVSGLMDSDMLDEAMSLLDEVREAGFEHGQTVYLGCLIDFMED